MTDAIQHFITTLFMSLGYGGVVLAMAIESCCIPLPSELIMPLAGFLATAEGATRFHIAQFSLIGIAIAGAVGCVIGSVVAYGIGAAGGRPLLLRYGRYVLISEHDADRADQFFARYGDPTIFFSRLLPIVRTFISLPAGIARMNPVMFVLYTFIGSLLWCLALGFAGVQLGKNWDSIGTQIHRFDIVIAVVLVALVAYYIYRHTRPGSKATARR